MGKTQILIVTHSYLPTINPRSSRWSSIAEYWAAKGYSIDIICAWGSGLARFEVLNGVHVYRVGNDFLGAIRSKSVKGEQNHLGSIRQANCSVAKSAVVNKLAALLKFIYNNTWKKIYWPDYACLWYFPAKKAAENLIAKKHYDCLITVSHPFTGHLVGLALKQSYKQLKWTVDIGDPFCFLDATPLNNPVLFKGLNYAVEGKAFNYAESIVVTTPAASEEYLKIFPGCDRKLYVIPPLLSCPEGISHEISEERGDEKIRLVFLGTLYKSIRNPKHLLKLFCSLLNTSVAEKVELHFYGNINDCYKEFDLYKMLVGTKIFIHGVQDRQKAFLAMQRANILINIGNSTSYQLPSKVIEYASTGKPILNLLKIENDSSIDFLKTYPFQLSLLDSGTGSIGEQSGYLLKFIETLPQDHKRESLLQWLTTFRVESIAAKYEKLI